MPTLFLLISQDCDSSMIQSAWPSHDAAVAEAERVIKAEAWSTWDWLSVRAVSPGTGGGIDTARWENRWVPSHTALREDGTPDAMSDLGEHVWGRVL